MNNLSNKQIKKVEIMINQMNITEIRNQPDKDKWSLIQVILLQHGYMSGVDRQSERVAKTGEVFTPAWLVLDTISKVDISSFGPNKKFLEPSCGDGQIVVACMLIKILFHNMSAENAVKDIYGVDIMRDNIDKCRERMIKAAGTIKQKLNMTTVKAHILCGNTLEPNKPPPIQYGKQTVAEAKLMKKYFEYQEVII